MVVNYKHAKIYKIVCNVTGLIYYGSTCVPLYRRITGHRSTFDRYNKGLSKNYLSSFQIMVNGDYNIIFSWKIPL